LPFGLAKGGEVGVYASLSTAEIVRLCSAGGDAGAWEEFVRRFHRLIAIVILRTASRLGDPSRQTVDDLIQDTYLKLCANNFRLLRNFDDPNPDAFLGYVKVVAANVARDYFKAQHSQKRGVNLMSEPIESIAFAAGNHQTGSPGNIERELMIREIARHLDICTSGPEQERNCKVFWLYYRVGLSANAIAALPAIGLTTKGVESLILRITRELRQQMTKPTHGLHDDGLEGNEGILPAESF
jgi:RNA polymerase sigma-70 factor, ECF subfamily